MVLTVSALEPAGLTVEEADPAAAPPLPVALDPLAAEDADAALLDDTALSTTDETEDTADSMTEEMEETVVNVSA